MYEKYFERIKAKARDRDRFVVCVEGKCGSGKTVFSQMAKDALDAQIIHIDDFYLPFDKRQENWQTIPRGNMDLDRLENTVLKPFANGESVTYLSFKPHGGAKSEYITLPGCRILIIDGSYSMHPQLDKYYDMKIFMTCDENVQTERLKKREGDRFEFFCQWIGREITYHNVFGIESKADIVIDTTELF